MTLAPKQRNEMNLHVVPTGYREEPAIRNVHQRRLGEGWLPAWGGVAAGLPSGSLPATLCLDS